MGSIPQARGTPSFSQPKGCRCAAESVATDVGSRVSLSITGALMAIVVNALFLVDGLKCFIKTELVLPSFRLTPTAMFSGRAATQTGRDGPWCAPTKQWPLRWDQVTEPIVLDRSVCPTGIDLTPPEPQWSPSSCPRFTSCFHGQLPCHWGVLNKINEAEMAPEKSLAA